MGLSSFGYSGTIAHVLLTATDDAPADPGCYSWPRPVVRPMACTLKRRPLAWRDPVHPLLQRRLPATPPALALFHSPVAGALRSLAAEHIVRSHIVFPGAAYLEMARAASSAFAPAPAGVALREIFFLRPLELPADAPGPEAAAWVECALLEGGGFEVRSGVEGAASDEYSATHCMGTHGAAAADGWRDVDEAALKRHCVKAADTAAFYASFYDGGLQYGPAYRRVEELWVSESGAEATARLRRRTDLQQTLVHPADLDGALQSTKVLASGEDVEGQIRLPFSVDAALMRGPAQGSLWVVRAPAGSTAAPLLPPPL